jgi:hypothetical protein
VHCEPQADKPVFRPFCGTSSPFIALSLTVRNVAVFLKNVANIENLKLTKDRKIGMTG